MFSYVPPEQQVRRDHPLQAIRAITNPVLQELSGEFDRLYANHINIGSFNAFEGRSSGFRMGALFPFGPSVEWLQWQHPTNSGDFVGLNGVSEVYFKGITIYE